MACVRMRVVDGSVLRLILQWLQAPVEDREEGGKPRRRPNRQGTPQGGVISPLLANIYLHWFDRVFHSRQGPIERWLGLKINREKSRSVDLQRSVARERERLRGIIHKKRCFQPLPELIGELNRHLKGWANYYRPGYSRAAFREINAHVRQRLTRHLRRRSQRAWHPPGGETAYRWFQRLGLIYL